MVGIQPLISEFTLVGKLEDFAIDSKGRIKYLSLSTSEEEYLIKVAKEQTRVLQQYLQPGCQIKVSGMRKYKLHKEEVEYKAYRIELVAEAAIRNTRVKPNRKTKILVCQGSSCCKKGSKTISKLLQSEIAAEGMTGEVEIKMTGCMKQCKQAPYLVMPGKNSYSRVQAKQIPSLVRSNLASLRGSKK